MYGTAVGPAGEQAEEPAGEQPDSERAFPGPTARVHPHFTRRFYGVAVHAAVGPVGGAQTLGAP